MNSFTMALKWLLGLVYLGLIFLLYFLFPDWLQLPLLGVVLLHFLWTYWTLEVSTGRRANLRPLTRWDVPGDPHFLERLDAASKEFGFTRPPYFTVQEDDWLNAYAVGGRRGLVVFTTEALKHLPPDQLLAVAGHELQHLAGRDHLPALVGGSWMAVLGRLSHLLQEIGLNTGGFVGMLPNLVALVLDLCLWGLGWVADAFLAKRSRLQEHIADLAGARLTSSGTMVAALIQLEERGPSRKITAPRWSGEWIAHRLHASHPPTEERIRYLERAAERGESVA